VTEDLDLTTLPDHDLIALELRWWNAIHNAAPKDIRARQERWREAIREVRRRRVFDLLIWK
jgi:hypothetical protein